MSGNFICVICQVDCGNAENLRTHHVGAAHLKRSNLLHVAPTLYRCESCNRDFTNANNLEWHCKGKDHLKVVKQLEAAAPPLPELEDIGDFLNNMEPFLPIVPLEQPPSPIFMRRRALKRRLNHKFDSTP